VRDCTKNGVMGKLERACQIIDLRLFDTLPERVVLVIYLMSLDQSGLPLAWREWLPQAQLLGHHL
jgi:hypothetical protein